jgi:hypothetical protein
MMSSLICYLEGRRPAGGQNRPSSPLLLELREGTSWGGEGGGVLRKGDRGLVQTTPLHRPLPNSPAL